MAEPRWTPGPWEVGEISRGDGYSYREISSPFHAFWLARVLAFDGGEDPHHRADASLIAAAPELYDALALYFAKGHQDTCSHQLCDEFKCDCGWELAELALAKARGEAVPRG